MFLDLYKLLDDNLQHQMDSFQKTMDEQVARWRAHQQEKEDLQANIMKLKTALTLSTGEVQSYKRQVEGLEKEV